MQRSIAGNAFHLEYKEDADDATFLKHLKKQFQDFLYGKSFEHAPFFAVIQRSGYGKSQLINQLAVHDHKDYDVIYWSFASEVAYLEPNVFIDKLHFKNHTRVALERAFQLAILEALKNAILESVKIQLIPKMWQPIVSQLAPKKKIIFVVDEASTLLDKVTGDGIYYFSLRSTFKKLEDEAKWLFFVVMSTFSSITHSSLQQAMDPSFKPYLGIGDHEHNPLEPFVLGNSF